MIVRMKALRTFSWHPKGLIPRGSEFEIREEIARELEKRRLAVRVTYETKVVTPQIKHIGGGWYELPDGSKVKGKVAAEKALKEMVGSGAQGQDNPDG
jgi:hypothetical protein